jgi:hypothetical protein
MNEMLLRRSELSDKSILLKTKSHVILAERRGPGYWLRGMLSEAKKQQ